MKAFKDLVMPLLTLILAAVVTYDHFHPTHVPSPAPAPAIDGAALGRSYKPYLVSAEADAWDEAATTLEGGKSVDDALRAFQDARQSRRQKAFAELVAPKFGVVLPEGTEPSSPEKRAEVVALWHAFAKGLRGGR